MTARCALMALVCVAASSARAAPEDEGLPGLAKQLKPVEIGPKDDDLTRLHKQRYNSALNIVQDRLRSYLTGRGGPDELYESFALAMRAKMALSDKPADQIAALELALQGAKEMEKIAEARFQAGRISVADVEHLRIARIEVEIALLQTKQKAKGGK
jgi:hypothetical protein